MNRVPSSFAVTLICSFMVTATLFSDAWSQPGTLLSEKKINSDTLATVGEPLGNGDEFGDSVASLGDLDGPGPSVVALAVGAVGDDDGGNKRGAVYVVFLNAAGKVLSYQKISDTQGNLTATLDDDDEFGGAVAGLGDLDGPGPSVAALAVGAIGDDDGGADRGAVYVLFLNNAGGVLSYQKISDTQGNFAATLDDLDELGGAIGSVGDLDGPGPSVAALVVGAIHDDDGGLDRGAIYTLFLNSAGSVLSYQKVSDTEGNFTAAFSNADNFGEDVASLGDLDGPGPSVLALAVTAVQDDDGGANRGAAYVLFLASTGSVLSFQKISDTQGDFAGLILDEDNFGSGVAGLGDLDGSGPSVAALAVSAGSDDGLGLDRGAVYVLFLNSTGSVLSYEEISSTAGNFGGQLDDLDEFGAAMAALGDIDGSGGGAQTLVCGASFDDDGGLDRGAVYLLSLAGGGVTAVDDSPTGPRWNGLRHARPNPFMHRGTTISFRINDVGQVRIEIWDASGRLVRHLLDEKAGSGEHQVAWDGLDDSGRSLAPGAYFLRMSVNGQTLPAGAKAILLR